MTLIDTHESHTQPTPLWDLDDYLASADRLRRLAHTTQEERHAAMLRGRAAGAKGVRRATQVELGL